MILIKNFKKLRYAFLPVIFLIFTVAACKITYSFSGASISPQIRTLSVQSFFNRAALMLSGLDQYVTDALIDKCKAQTSLRIVSELGDVDFEGEITDYKTQPVTIAANDFAAVNRFTITVRVKFTNTVEPQYSYDQSFSSYIDYESSEDWPSAEQRLYPDIIKVIIEEIFNKAFVNW